MPDFLGSLLVFALLITVFFSAWNSIVKDQTEFSDEKEMRVQGRRTTTFLVSTPGYPDNWNSSNVQIPGFADPDHMLQLEKLESFDNLSYENQKEALQAEDFYLAIENETSVIVSGGEKLEYGRNYSGAGTIVPFTRKVQLNISGKITTATLEYVVWR